MNLFDRSKWKINKGILWLKIGYSFWSLGVVMVLPFLSLQLANIGLSDKEISYVLGFMPYILILTLPVSGYLGDKIGYKPIIIWDAIIVGSALTSYMFIPTDKVSIKSPYVDIGPQMVDSTFPLLSVNWPLCNGDKDTTDIDKCAQSWLADTDSSKVQEFLADINEFVNCSHNNVNNLTISVPGMMEFSNTTESSNGTFCALTSDFDALFDNVTSCSLYHPNLTETCTTVSGKHKLTFWIVFGLTLVFKMQMNSGFALLDGISVRLAAIHNSTYTSIQFWCNVFNAIAPFLASLTIRDSDTFGETDYSLMYYTCDGILVLTILIFFFKVDMTVERETMNQESMFSALKKIWSVPFAILMFGTFTAGLLWGIHDVFLFLFLQRELGASSQLLSYASVLGWISTLIFLPFANKIVRKVGEMNAIFIQLVVESLRFFIYSYWSMSPPYYTLGLHLLEFTMWGWSWIAIIEYGYKITPPHYAATVTSIIALVEFIISKSLAILIGGQLSEIMTLPEIFRISGITATGMGVILLIIYYCFVRKYEKELVVQLNEEYPDRFKNKPNTGFVPSFAPYFHDENSKVSHI